QDDARPDADGAHIKGAPAGRGGRVRLFADPAPERVPEAQKSRAYRGVTIARQHDPVAVTGSRAAKRSLEMPVDARAEVERRHAQRVGVREPPAKQRVDDGERLRGLLRVEVVAFRLVGEIQTGADD